jgi:hypothetical protein
MPDTARRVRQVDVPPAARALSTLDRIDYADTFLVEVGAVQDRSPEQWARAILEDAPIMLRTRLLLGWPALGLKPAGGGSGRSVLGWQIRRNTPDFVLAGRDSLIGMPAELLFKRERHGLLFATFVRHDNHVARAAWATVESAHVRIVRDVLTQTSRRLPQANPPTPTRKAHTPA